MSAAEQDARTFDVVVDGSELSVTVTPGESAEAGAMQVSVDGQPFSVTVTQTGQPSVRPDAVLSPSKEPVEGPSERATPTAPRPQPAQPTPAARPEPVEGRTQAAPGERLLTAPMPGTVVRYTVSESQRVAAGETVVVLEAMKMENTLPAPVGGVVKSLPQQAGARVTRGAVLAVIATE